MQYLAQFDPFSCVECSNVRYLEHNQVCTFSSGHAYGLLFNQSKAFVKNADPVRHTVLCENSIDLLL